MSPATRLLSTFSFSFTYGCGRTISARALIFKTAKPEVARARVFRLPWHSESSAAFRALLQSVGAKGGLEADRDRDRVSTSSSQGFAPSFTIKKQTKQQQHLDASMNARLNDVPLDELGVFFQHDVTMLREWLCPTPELPYRSREEGRKNGQTPVKTW